MRKKIFINALHPEESRVAIVEEGILSEYEVEFAGREQHRGNIYKGIVVNTEPGLQAAFVNYGEERLGFLQISEVNLAQIHGPDHPRTEGYPRIEQVLKPRQEILVQVVKDERGSKGAALTTYISLPGRYMVLMPFNDTRGVSRKIDSEAQRKKIKTTMASFDLPENTGYIVRTAAVGHKKEELRKDIDYLLAINEKVLDLYKEAKAPALIYQESNMVIRFLRDYFDTDMSAVVVDNPQVFREAKQFFQDVLPDYAGLVKLHRERRPIFSRYQIEEQIAGIARNKVNLPSGGSIVIDVTEALVAIDVNSGKAMGEGDIEKTAFKTNMEATTEIARQLRLRDLGGLIVIDLIDMRDKNHIREVEKNLKEALSKDKARVNLSRISKFGLLEMSRQRIKTTLGEKSYAPCPYCQGSGQMKRVEALGISFLRKLEAGLTRENIEKVEGETTLEIALYLLNEKRTTLAELEKKYKTVISIKGRPELKSDSMEISFQRREKPAMPRLTAEEEKSSKKAEQMTPPEAEPDQPDEVQEKPAKAAKENGQKKATPRKQSHKKSTAKTQGKPLAASQAVPDSGASQKTTGHKSATVPLAPEPTRTGNQGTAGEEPAEKINPEESKKDHSGQKAKSEEPSTDKPSASRRKPRRRNTAKKTEKPAADSDNQSASSEKEASGTEKNRSKSARSRPSRSRQSSNNKQTQKKSADENEIKKENSSHIKTASTEKQQPKAENPPSEAKNEN